MSGGQNLETVTHFTAIASCSKNVSVNEYKNTKKRADDKEQYYHSETIHMEPGIWKYFNSKCYLSERCFSVVSRLLDKYVTHFWGENQGISIILNFVVGEKIQVVYEVNKITANHI